MNRVSDAGNAQDTLRWNTNRTGQCADKNTSCEENLTSVEPGSIPSLAFNLAPLAS